MGKNWTFRQSFAFLLIFVPALAFYALRNKSLQTASGTVLQGPAYFIQEQFDTFTHHLSAFVQRYLILVDIKAENLALKKELSLMTAKTQILKETQIENQRLGVLLDFKKGLTRQSLAARVISKDIILDNNSFVIDKGSSHGVQRLQAVIAPDGVVGYVTQVSANSSRVLLLTDRSANIDATIQRTRARGILSGVSGSLAELKYIMREEDLTKGDLIVTSGRQGYFPSGFVVGQVQSVTPSSAGVSFRALVKPAVEVDKLEEVLILINVDAESSTDAETAS